MTSRGNPRVLMIAQWPAIKNAEFELIERARHTGFKVTVVDFLGFDVQTGRCINDATLPDEYDFAVSLHYETPKFLNLPTFHWVANPLEFIQGQSHYRTHLIHHLRSYDDFLYNGSQYLKEHIRSLVGTEWVDGGLAFYQSCSRKALIEPRLHDETAGSSAKLFYCGINWEAISDKDGRAQGLLEILQERQIADFYGPQTVLNVNVWGGFSSYRGEIPFDGSSMFPAMNGYAAVLALSSPAHLKSRTSSGRALEGFTSGVPVISDENHHVRTQFGDLVYYFDGATERERADSIQEALEEIRSRPDLALERVREAQSLISREYCFEACLERIQKRVRETRVPLAAVSGSRAKPGAPGLIIDIFLFFHDPYAPDRKVPDAFANFAHLEQAIMEAAGRHGARFRVFRSAFDAPLATVPADESSAIEWSALPADCRPGAEWARMRLGEKVSRLARLSTGDFAVFLTQSDFPQYDYFLKALDWFVTQPGAGRESLHVGGFFVSDLSTTAALSAGGILRCSASNGLYRWTQNSIAEHQLGQMCFGKGALRALDLGTIERYDVLAPVVLVLECMRKHVPFHRSRYLLLRSRQGYYHRYYDAFRTASGKGIWAQHYELLSNASHEINGLYDSFHEAQEVVAIADKILGIDLPPPPPVAPPPPPPPPTDPAVYQVANFLHRIAPYVVRVKRIARVFGIKL